jgi:L-lactate permease
MRHIALFFGIFGAFLSGADFLTWVPFHAEQVLTAEQLNDSLYHAVELALSCCISLHLIFYYLVTMGTRVWIEYEWTEM